MQNWAIDPQLMQPCRHTHAIASYRKHPPDHPKIVCAWFYFIYLNALYTSKNRHRKTVIQCVCVSVCMGVCGSVCMVGCVCEGWGWKLLPGLFKPLMESKRNDPYCLISARLTSCGSLPADLDAQWSAWQPLTAATCMTWPLQLCAVLLIV